MNAGILVGLRIVTVSVIVALGTAASTRPSALASTVGDTVLGTDPVPMMAYYYIWFEESSWQRAKRDLPLLGPYGSDDRAVMEAHVALARDAGIDGFIVSWKSTPKLDRRLAMLAEIAAEHDFHLWIIYQGLDFARDPLPVSRIDADLELFIDTFAASPAFGMYGKPVVIWSGTWEFAPDQIFAITSGYRQHLLILASERNVAGFDRIAHLVDGNAYYWASVNPDTFVGYQEKLDAMARAVHAAGGLWVAPAAPGFDARLLGGTSLVERHGGATLARQLDAATRSSPDAIGLISWNEFSENTHVEPSEHYGDAALAFLAGRSMVLPPAPVGFDSDGPSTTDRDAYRSVYILIGSAIAVALSMLAVVRRT